MDASHFVAVAAVDQGTQPAAFAKQVSVNSRRRSASARSYSENVISCTNSRRFKYENEPGIVYRTPETHSVPVLVVNSTHLEPRLMIPVNFADAVLTSGIHSAPVDVPDSRVMTAFATAPLTQESPLA